MNEATCKAAVAKLLRAHLVPRGGIVYRHEDTFTGGIPDLSASLDGQTVWAEFKLDRPGRRSKLTELQARALRALRGLEVRYAVDREGLVSAEVRDSAGEVLTSSTSRRAAFVHGVVAGFILSRLSRATLEDTEDL